MHAQSVAPLPYADADAATLIGIWEESARGLLAAAEEAGPDHWNDPTPCPGWSVGDVIVVRPVPFDELRKGDVITYNIPVEDNRVVTHRIVSIRPMGRAVVVRTKGDANNAADDWDAVLQGSTAWRYERRIPKAGYVIQTLRGPWLQRLSYVAIGLFTILALWRVWAPQRPEPVDAEVREP